MRIGPNLVVALAIGLLFAGQCSAQPEATKPDDEQRSAADLATSAREVLERNCLRCHRGPGSSAEFDVRSPESLVANGVIEKGKPKDSLLWTLAHRGTMPPRGQLQLPRPSPADAEIIGEWIAAGAPPFPKAKPREFIKLESALRSIHDDLKKLRDPKDRRRQRYFSLIEWHNNPTIRDETLKVAQAALGKVLNSLSWKKDVVVPRSIDATQTVFAIDLESLGWRREHWLAIRGRYPYTLGYKNLRDPMLDDLDKDIVELGANHEPLYVVRADWLVATATQPALYHALLYDLSLPELQMRTPDATQPANPRHMTALDLEDFLRVEVLKDIQKGGERARRSGFTPSGVSGQNRMIERHKSDFGAYWKSYDFKADNRRAILSQFPLGPVFAGNRFPKLAFEHDGGEIIFHLPNACCAFPSPRCAFNCRSPPRDSSPMLTQNMRCSSASQRTGTPG